MSTPQVTNSQADQSSSSSESKTVSSPMESMMRAFGSLMVQGGNMMDYLKEILQEGEQLYTQGEEMSSEDNFSDMYQEVGDLNEGSSVGVAGGYSSSMMNMMGPDATDPTSSAAQADYSQAMYTAGGEEDMGKGLMDFVQGEISNMDSEGSALLNTVQAADTSQVYNS